MSIYLYTIQNKNNLIYILRVILELPGVGAIGKDKITTRFLDRGFQIKIHDYKGKNWVFGVVKTLNKIDPEGCKFMLK